MDLGASKQISAIETQHRLFSHLYFTKRKHSDLKNYKISIDSIFLSRKLEAANDRVESAFRLDIDGLVAHHAEQRCAAVSPLICAQDRL